MSLVLRGTYKRATCNVTCGNSNSSLPSYFYNFIRRYTDENNNKNPELCSSTILIESGSQVQELPVVVRKLKDLTEFEEKPKAESARNTAQDYVNYNLIQAEFKHCMNLRDVFSLLSKCTKITPNIALGAVERIYDIERDHVVSNGIESKSFHVNIAKGAILDKLLKVILMTEDTQTIINILNTESTFMDPCKLDFCNELLIRVLDNRLSIEQLCQFSTFLIKNKTDPKFSDTVDKLWVGFIVKEGDINEKNIVQIFKVLSGLRTSKRTIMALLEQKLSDLWYKINVLSMHEILNIFIQEKYLSLESFAVVGCWLNKNIHALDEDALLDVITKLTKLYYTDDHIEKAVEKYMKLKGSKIKTHVLIVGILNYCMEFKIRNEIILNGCCEFFLKNGSDIPTSFLKSFIHPFGILCFYPIRGAEFWLNVENILNERFEKLSPSDICFSVLAFIYNGKYPLKLVNRMFSQEYVLKVTHSDIRQQLHLIDTSLSLECCDYMGPLLPKDQWLKPIAQDSRVKNILSKIEDTLIAVAGSRDHLSMGVSIPYLCPDRSYLIDAMVHPAGLGGNTYSWKIKSKRNENTAILIHLPDHYCSDNQHLIGPQIMRVKHLRMLGMKVVSLKYALLSKFYTSHNTHELKKYIVDGMNNAEQCL